MDTRMSVAAVSSSLSYSSKSLEVRTANGYAKVQEESLRVSVRADSVSIGMGQSLLDPKSKNLDLKALLASATEESANTDDAGPQLTEMQKAMKDLVVDQMKQAQAALKANGQDSKLIDDILYAVDQDQKAAEVPEEWGAGQTSQRIVDFAAAFRESAKGMSDEDFVATIRNAIQDGFRQAKDGLEKLPEATAKLFNDTYQATMKKLDDLLASWREADPDDQAVDEPAEALPSTAPVAEMEPDDPQLGVEIPASVSEGRIQPAPVPAGGAKPASTFSVVA